jgi:hypothetical protein
VLALASCLGVALTRRPVFCYCNATNGDPLKVKAGLAPPLLDGTARNIETVPWPTCLDHNFAQQPLGDVGMHYCVISGSPLEPEFIGQKWHNNLSRSG